MTERKRWIGLVLIIVSCLGAGGLGTIATTPEIEGWYETIEKPTWNPPAYVFRSAATAGWLMLPYLLWVSFASVLNFTIWRLNAG